MVYITLTELQIIKYLKFWQTTWQNQIWQDLHDNFHK
jgi:hypothetical protein